MKQQFNIEYSDDEGEKSEDGRSWHITQRVRKRCVVEVSVDLERLARVMGPRACINKSGQSRAGLVMVKCVGTPTTISREAVNRESNTNA
jgi:hypothetical protein